MTTSVTIRLRAEDRETLESEARERGSGLSTLVRALAEDEARRVRRERIRKDGESVIAHLKSSESARDELDDYGGPLADLP